MTTSQIFGFVATGLVIVGYIPQIVHVIKKRCTAGTSILALQRRRSCVEHRQEQSQC